MSPKAASLEPGRPTRLRRLRSGLQAVGEAALIGLAIGAYDANSTNSGSDWLYLIAGMVVGWRHLGLAWFAWLPLGTGLYLAHRVAIARGYAPPFVESDAMTAKACISAMFPSGIGLAIGSFARIILESIIPPIRRGGLRRKFWPRTILGMLLFIAKIAMTFALIHWALYDFHTVYSPRYSEWRFHQIRQGMSAAELETLMGPPLANHDWGSGTGSDRRKWAYTIGASDTSNYCRRWVFIEGGKVDFVVSDDWID